MILIKINPDKLINAIDGLRKNNIVHLKKLGYLAQAKKRDDIACMKQASKVFRINKININNNNK